MPTWGLVRPGRSRARCQNRKFQPHDDACARASSCPSRILRRCRWILLRDAERDVPEGDAGVLASGTPWSGRAPLDDHVCAHARLVPRARTVHRSAAPRQPVVSCVLSWRGDTSTSLIGPSSADLAVFHDDDVVAESPRERQVVRDLQHERHAARSSRRRFSSVRMSRCVVTRPGHTSARRRMSTPARSRGRPRWRRVDACRPDSSCGYERRPRVERPTSASKPRERWARSSACPRSSRHLLGAAYGRSERGEGLAGQTMPPHAVSSSVPDRSPDRSLVHPATPPCWRIARMAVSAHKMVRASIDGPRLIRPRCTEARARVHAHVVDDHVQRGRSRSREATRPWLGEWTEAGSSLALSFASSRTTPIHAIV